MNGKKCLKYFLQKFKKYFGKVIKKDEWLKMPKVFFYRSSKSISAKSFWKSYEK
jgi:hypothetical protein